MVDVSEISAGCLKILSDTAWSDSLAVALLNPIRYVGIGIRHHFPKRVHAIIRASDHEATMDAIELSSEHVCDAESCPLAIILRRSLCCHRCHRNEIERNNGLPRGVSIEVEERARANQEAIVEHHRRTILQQLPRVVVREAAYLPRHRRITISALIGESSTHRADSTHAITPVQVLIYLRKRGLTSGPGIAKDVRDE